MTGPRFWTEALRLFVAANAPHTPDREIARMLTVATGTRVTPRAVTELRRRLGVRRG